MRLKGWVGDNAAEKLKISFSQADAFRDSTTNKEKERQVLARL